MYKVDMLEQAAGVDEGQGDGFIHQLQRLMEEEEQSQSTIVYLKVLMATFSGVSKLEHV